MNTVAIIPARGGSKGIPKKNIRLLAGKPLISYVIHTAGECPEIDDVYVSTDSMEIADAAVSCGAAVVERGEELSGDHVTLDPVIYDALQKIEKERGCTYDLVVTMQPTSPLLKSASLSEAFRKMREQDADCMISVVNKPHLSWKIQDGKTVPGYGKRCNRQELPPDYVETGAFVISRRNVITGQSRIGGKVSLFEVPEDESIDIDDRHDWMLSESLLNRKRILFRVDGYAALGMGHIYNCIALAYAMMEHDVLLVMQEKSREGIKKVEESNLPYRLIRDDEEMDAVIREFRPDIWVNDRLDSSKSYIRHIKSLVPRVVTIEDLGEGARCADAVINALYTESELEGYNVFSGWRYVCLRDEFQAEKPGPFSDEVRNVMIMFGGTDPGNYNKMIYRIITRIAGKYRSVCFHFIAGIGYDIEKNGLYTVEEKNIFVHPNVQRVTRFMKKADLAITSQGRAIFEFASMGVPAIVISQNEREKMHSFANMEHGFINLGMGGELATDLVENTLDWLISTKAVRKNMRDLMLKYPLREGLDRVKNIIIGNVNGAVRGGVY